MDLAKVTIKVDADLSDVKEEFEQAEEQAERSGKDAAKAFNKGLSRAGDVDIDGITARGSRRGGRRGGRLGGIGAATGAALGATVTGLARTAAVAGTAALGIGAALGVAGVAATGFVASLYKASTEGSVAAAGLENVRKQMGFAGKEYKNTQEELMGLSREMSLSTGVNRDMITSGQTLIATFSEVGKTMNVRGGLFDRATIAALDLAAAGFGSVESNATQLGKALNDPTKGMSALAESGVTFTSAEQEKIKALQESGKLLKAQDIIMKAIEVQVGGTAEATASAAGKLTAAWEIFKGEAGDAIAPAVDDLLETVRTSLLPAVTELWDGLSPKVNTWIEDFGTWLKSDGEEAIKGFFEWVGNDGIRWVGNLANAVVSVAGFVGSLGNSIDDGSQAIAQAQALENSRLSAQGKPTNEKGPTGRFVDNLVIGAKNSPGFFMSLADGAVNSIDSALSTGNFTNPVGEGTAFQFWKENAQQRFQQEQRDAERKRLSDLGVSGWESRIPGFAKGGYVTKPTLSMIGEAGPEYVIPEKRLNSMMRGGDVNVNVVVEGNGDSQQIKQAVERALDETMQRGALRLVTAGGY